MERGEILTEENEKKKEYLKRYEKAMRQLKRHEERINEIRGSAVNISVISDGMPHSHNKSDLSSYAVQLDREERKYLKARYQRLIICNEIFHKIELLENEDEKDVLIYRYIKLLRWEDIAVKMQYSWQHVHKIHSRALQNFML